MARLNVQMLHSAILGLWNGEDGEMPQLDAKEAMQLSTALKNLVQASRTDQIRYAETRKLLEEERARIERAKQAVDDAVAGAGAGRGDALAVLKRIREDVYGIFER